MRNTSGRTRKERKALRKIRKARWVAELTPYYLNVEVTSRAGITYYKLAHNKYGLTPVYD